MPEWIFQFAVRFPRKLLGGHNYSGGAGADCPLPYFSRLRHLKVQRNRRTIQFMRRMKPVSLPAISEISSMNTRIDPKSLIM
jgi:hypothetical protein